ncbi:MAG: glycosyltransferase [Candidatus Omnitrophica bacterium]|nr:glycosyltransferase [Candidatus Omnitrophota bacterium]
MEARVNNTLVVIPSYNEARAIGQIVADIVDMGMSVLVIDDGSTDNTEKAALDAGAMVIRHKVNLGKGYSVREGFKYAMEKLSFEWMIMMDGDGQHHTEDIPIFLNATHSSDCTIVNGNRMLSTGEMPVVRFFTNRFMSGMISLICGQRIPDTQCGFRLIKVEALRKLDLVSDNYDIESEMLMQASRKGMKVKSVPIRTIYGEEISEIHPVKDTLRFFRLIWRFILSGRQARR